MILCRLDAIYRQLNNKMVLPKITNSRSNIKTGDSTHWALAGTFFLKKNGINVPGNNTLKEYYNFVPGSLLCS